MTDTDSTSIVCVVPTSFFSLCARRKKVIVPKRQSAPGTTRNHRMRLRPGLVLSSCGDTDSFVIGTSGLVDLFRSRDELRFGLPNHGKNDRDKEKSGDGGEEKPADNSSAKRCILLATISQSKSHGNHSDNHCKSGHHHRAQTSRAGLQRGLDGVSA